MVVSQNSMNRDWFFSHEMIVTWHFVSFPHFFLALGTRSIVMTMSARTRSSRTARPNFTKFYPHDAVLARYQIGPVSVCVCHKSEFHWNGWMNQAGFGTGASSRLSYIVLKENARISKTKGTSLWNFVPNSWKFCFVEGNVLSTSLGKVLRAW